MLKNILIALSISLFAVACGGGAAEEAKSPDDAAKMPAADAPKEGDAAKPAEGDAAKPADPAKPADAAAAPK